MPCDTGNSYNPKIFHQMLFYAQGMADAIKETIYIQENFRLHYWQAVTSDAVNPDLNIVATVSPNEDTL